MYFYWHHMLQNMFYSDKKNIDIDYVNTDCSFLHGIKTVFQIGTEIKAAQI